MTIPDAGHWHRNGRSIVIDLPPPLPATENELFEIGKKLPIDEQRSTRWAIASVSSAGLFGVNHTTFDLVNLTTGRAHRLNLSAGGLSAKLPISSSFSMSNYSSFTTRRPVNFDNFHGRGARQTNASVVVYSISYLTIFDGPVYLSPVLCKVKMSGWGPSLPSIGFEHGVTEVAFGDGKALDEGGFFVEPQIDLPPSPEKLDVRVRLTQRADSMVIKFQGDTLFDFDKDTIRPDAEAALKQAGAIIRSLPVRRLDVDGHTDSKGDSGYNLRLSQRRANAVSQWLTSHQYLRKGLEVRAKGLGESKPVAPNKRRDGSDDPVGRQKNRRVELILVKK
jgi:outer membrane protein OmpA-like peptidoglycan-associated protein